ncbi:MAG: hypothetical protein IJB32_05255, partial [Clostridia bacterium]|nr:hypothetical protein [Clostridia bacterium]
MKVFKKVKTYLTGKGFITTDILFDDKIRAFENITGSEEIFIEMMNNFVLDKGLKNTHFDNPHGLDSDTHYTSAYDLAVITAYA